MKNVRHSLIGFLLLLAASTTATAQETVAVKVKDQRVSNDTLYFSVYMERTSSNDIYLANADFVLDFNYSNFSSPVFGYVANSAVLVNSNSNSTAFYESNIATEIGTGDNANRLLVNVQPPAFSNSTEFDARVAKIDNTTETHYLGTFFVKGVSNASIAAELAWVTSGTAVKTKVYTFASSSPYRSSAVNVTATDPTPATEPTGQPTFAVSSYTDSSITLSFSNSNGDSIIILGRSAAAVGSNYPADGFYYLGDTIFGSGDKIGSTDVYVVYNAANSTGTVTIYGLTAGTEYHFSAFSYSGGKGQTENYYTTNAPVVSQSTLKAEPTQATSLLFSAASSNSLNLEWTNGNGDGVIVLAREASAVDTVPVDSVTYTANAAYGSGSQVGTGNYVVYAGSGTSVQVTGLSSGTEYHFAVFSYNGTGNTTNYTTTSPATNSRSTIGSEPAIVASNSLFRDTTDTSITIAFTAGSGSSRIVVVKEGSSVDADPADGTTYSASTVFGSGDQLGTGNYIVYNGSDTFVTITGLTQNKNYYFEVFEYSGGTSSENYNTSSTLVDTANTYMTVTLTAMLEGPYTGSTMDVSLYTNNYIPTSQPYSGSPWNYGGTESVSSIPANVVDWVLIEVRKAGSSASNTTSDSVRARKAVFIKNDGTLIDTNGAAFAVMPITEAGTFYVVIYHRNHLPVMSASTISLSSGHYNFNFTSGNTQAYGTGAQVDLGSGVYGMYSGRVENSTAFDIDASDRSAVWNNRNKTGYEIFDCTLDGVVDASDRTAIWNNTGKGSQLP